jgi:hypothetical protein
METSLEFRESPPATVFLGMKLLVAEVSTIAVAIAMTVLAVELMANTTVLAVELMANRPAAFVMVTVAGVPLVAAAKLHARIVTVGLFYPTSNVQLANGLATWLNTATCWPLQSASNGT